MIAIIHAIGRWFAIGLLLLMHAAPAWAAEEASSVHGAPLPTLSSDKAPMVLVAVGGRPVVIQHGSAHILKADRSGWTVLDRRQLGPDPQITGSITDGHRTVLLLGGSAERRTDRAALLQLDGNALRGKLLPPLPVALSSAQGAIQGSALLMAGVADDGASRLLRLTLSDGSQGWVEQPAWPGNGTPTALVSQGAGIFLTLDNGRRQMRWTAKSGWQTRAPAPGPVIAGSGRPISQANMLYLLSEAQGSAGLYSYNMITDAWARLGHRQAGGVIATLPFGNGLLSAWQRGNRLDFATAELELKRRPLDLLDWAVIGLYMVAMLSVGFYFYRRSKHGSASEFFLGSRTIPFWAAGVSMFAVNTSSISYLAIPAKAFDTNWEYMMSKIVTVAGLIFVAIWVIPIFRRLNLVSVYNYLELRFHPAIRMLVSALSILMHVGGRMGIVLFLPALAIGTITGTNVALCILILGICTIIYTALGGMRAVVWTDFFQVIVLMGGAIFAIGFIVHSLGIMPIYETAMQFDKAHLVNVSFDFTQPTIWGFIILILFDTVLTFPKDQVLMQRALSTSSAKQASRSIWLFGAVLLPGVHLLPHGHGSICLLPRQSGSARSAVADRRGVSRLYRHRTAARRDRHDHRRIVRRGDGLAVGHHQQRCDIAVGRFLREVHQGSDVEKDRALRRVDDGRHRPGRHRHRDHPFDARHSFAARPHDRAVRPVGRKLRRSLYARHVHPSRQLAGGCDRHRNRLAGDAGCLGPRLGAPLFLSGHCDRDVDRGWLCREPVLSAATGFARRPDDFRQARSERGEPGGGAIDINFLKTFVAVVDHGSMAAAARTLNISPSAIAQQLHALERELGAPLIVRVGRTVRMTEPGGRILNQARQLLRDADDLRRIANGDELSGELRLGACTTALVGMLPEILARVSGKCPQVNVHIQSGNSSQLYAEVEAGNLDAAFVLEAPYLLPKTCDWTMLREELLILLAPPAPCPSPPA